ncbi:hypothetical protein [Streptomyces clavifer]|uniref:hypothetical protein n=1 Tax=Streptomyces clavifer TaxID=68188 RepID=UPI003820B01B
MTAAVPPLDDVTGARQELTVVLPVRLLCFPEWPEGPFPFEMGNRRTDARIRSTYFTPASARALYGAPGRTCRWHLPLDVKHDGMRLLGMELLRAATARKPQQALAVLHFTVERPLLPVVRALAGRLPREADAPLSGPFDPARLLDGVADLRAADAPSFDARPYTIAFLSPAGQHTPTLRASLEGELPATATVGCGSWRHAPLQRTSLCRRRPLVSSSRTPSGSRRTGAPWYCVKGQLSSATGQTQGRVTSSPTVRCTPVPSISTLCS